MAINGEDNLETLSSRVTAQKQNPGFAMDRYFYQSAVVYERELDRVLFRSWIYAGHVGQLSNPGDFLQFKLGDDAIIVCRDQQGQVNAFYNTCRHRGSRICEANVGNTKSFVCPYHGWVYNLDGSLRAARGMDALEGFDAVEYGLRSPQLTLFHGLIFINCDEGADSFEPELAIVDSPLGAYDLAHAQVADVRTYQVSANWKLALENYLECYHCATAHRAYARLHTLKESFARVKEINEAMLARTSAKTGVEGLTEITFYAYTDALTFGGGVDHSRYALYEGYLTGSRDGQPIAPLMGQFKGYDGGAGDFQFGPLSFMLNYPDHCLLYRFIPRGQELTDMEVVWFVRGDAIEGVDYKLDELTWLWHQTTLEDERIIMRNSEGVKSRAYKPGPYHPEHEKLCMQFVRWYLDAMDA